MSFSRIPRLIGRGFHSLQRRAWVESFQTILRKLSPWRFIFWRNGWGNLRRVLWQPWIVLLDSPKTNSWLGAFWASSLVSKIKSEQRWGRRGQASNGLPGLKLNIGRLIRGSCALCWEWQHDEFRSSSHPHSGLLNYPLLFCSTARFWEFFLCLQ